jgi:hypothetical protein
LKCRNRLEAVVGLGYPLSYKLNSGAGELIYRAGLEAVTDRCYAITSALQYDKSFNQTLLKVVGRKACDI